MNRPKRDPPPDDAMTNEQVVELVSVQVLAMRAEMNRRFEDVEARLERIEARGRRAWVSERRRANDISVYWGWCFCGYKSEKVSYDG